MEEDFPGTISSSDSDLNSTEHVNESMETVEAAIRENEVTQDMAESLARMYTLYTTKQLDKLTETSPNLKEMIGFNQVLKDALKKAEEEGDYTDIKRFLSVESERQEPEIGKKLKQMSELLPVK